MRSVRILQLLTWSTFVVQGIAAFVFLFVQMGSDVSVFKIEIPEDVGKPLLLLCYVYPIVVGLVCTLIFALTYEELRRTGFNIKLHIVASLINLLSLVWSPVVLALMIMFLYGFEWRPF